MNLVKNDEVSRKHLAVIAGVLFNQMVQENDPLADDSDEFVKGAMIREFERLINAEPASLVEKLFTPDNVSKLQSIFNAVQNINKEHLEYVEESSLMKMIYTHQDQDWEALYEKQKEAVRTLIQSTDICDKLPQTHIRYLVRNYTRLDIVIPI